MVTKHGILLVAGVFWSIYAKNKYKFNQGIVGTNKKIILRVL